MPDTSIHGSRVVAVVVEDASKVELKVYYYSTLQVTTRRRRGSCGTVVVMMRVP